jgi:hypothetical protein
LLLSLSARALTARLQCTILAVFDPGFKTLTQSLATKALLSGVCLLSLAAGDRSLYADPGREAPLPEPTLAKNLDGLYLMIGVEGGPIRIESDWDSSVGGHLGLMSFGESRALSLVGLDLGIAQYGERPGGRIWLAPTVATNRLGVLIGATAGIAAEWEPFARERGMSSLPTPRLGASGSVWVFAGVVPYVGVGTFAQSGSFIEIGLRLALPAIRFTRKALP